MLDLADTVIPSPTASTLSQKVELMLFIVFGVLLVPMKG